MSSGQFKTKSEAQASEVTLELLTAVEGDEALSQRGLAERLGVALGLTNSLIKRCVKKGYLKVRQAPARRFAYYLTPRGFSEKSRLTAEFLSSSLDFYRHARAEYAEVFEYCKVRGWNRVALAGSGELAEIAILTSLEAGVTLQAVIDSRTNMDTLLGVPIVRSIDDVADGAVPEVIVLSATEDPQLVFDRLAATFGAARIIAPPMHRISIPPRREVEQDP